MYHQKRMQFRQTLQNILGPGPKIDVFTGRQYVLMDFRSRENSKVNSFFHMAEIPWLTTTAVSRRFRPVFWNPNGFIFSARTTKAVSVASPTFSNICLYCGKTNVAKIYFVIQCIYASKNYTTPEKVYLKLQLLSKKKC